LNLRAKYRGGKNDGERVGGWSRARVKKKTNVCLAGGSGGGGFRRKNHLMGFNGFAPIFGKTPEAREAERRHLHQRTGGND